MYFVFDGEQRYEVVSGDVGTTSTQLPGVWCVSTTLLTDVYLAYHYQRELSKSEASSRKLDALLYAMSSAMGVWESEDDEDL